jgi:hypothetical protein
MVGLRAHQDRAIALWPDNVAGWKVGRIAPPWRERVGEDGGRRRRAPDRRFMSGLCHKLGRCDV